MRAVRPMMVTFFAASIMLTGCSAADAPDERDEALTIYATTGYLADAAANIAPDAEVTTMVGPGGDPHTYQLSTRDIQEMRSADIVLWNGLYLEAQMVDQLTSLDDRQLAVGDQLPAELLLAWPETDHEGNPLHDPHIWNSPEAWSLVVDMIADKLGDVDPQHATEYLANADAFTAEIAATAERAEALLADITGPRILVTGHDAFAYFGDTYGFEVHATDVISSEAQLSPGDISRLADLIADNDVRVLFGDNQANPQAMTSLQEALRARGHDVDVAPGELYADSLGSEPGVDTYLGVFEHNARVIAEALHDQALGES